MKGLGVAVGVVLISLGLVAAAVFGLEDGEILVSPPENVAREFVRALSLGQTGAAREMLSRDARRRTPGTEVRRIALDFRGRFGRMEEVEGIVAKRAPDTAIVRTRIRGERRDAEPSLFLVRESGEWVVARAGDVLGVHDQ